VADSLTPLVDAQSPAPSVPLVEIGPDRRSRTIVNAQTVTGAVLLLIVIADIVAGMAFGPAPNYQTDALNQAPALAHLFGTDSFGRDLFSRISSGALVSVEVALGSAIVATLVGLPLGMIAGFRPTSWLDEIIMRILDVVLALPLLVLGVCVMGFLGPGPFSVGSITFPPVVKVILLLGGAGAPIIARVARSAVLVEREEDYVNALRVVGVPRRTILFNDILRNVAPTVTVQATAWMATAIVAEAALGFLGLGIQPPAATLGNILQQSSGALLLGQWWLVVFPGVMVVVVIAGFNLLGDGLAKGLFDPPR
jgi:peptide/nickel transport system permease protein